MKARERWPNLAGNTAEISSGQASESTADANVNHPGLNTCNCCCRHSELVDHREASPATDAASALHGVDERRLADAPTGRVFISYVHEDAEHVDELQRMLERAGIEVWRDTERIWPGQDPRVAIQSAISSGCLAFIACFSDTSYNKVSSYQNEELRLAVEQLRLRQPGVPWLFPVRFDPCKLPDFNLGGGQMLDSLHCANLYGPQRQTESNRLILAVRQSLTGLPMPSSTDSATSSGEPRRRRISDLTRKDPRKMTRSRRHSGQ